MEECENYVTLLVSGAGRTEPVAQESVVDAALLRSNFRPFKTAFLCTSCTQIETEASEIPNQLADGSAPTLKREGKSRDPEQLAGPVP